MDENSQVSSSRILRVAAGEDLFGEHWRIGINVGDFKVTSPDGSGMLILEATTYVKGGPVRHLHHVQDEWFYVLEGEYIIEVGQERFTAKPGDSVFAPRNLPHVWAYIGEGRWGRLLGVHLPAGQMEAFFREMSKKALPPGPEDFRAYDMEMVGPPLKIE